MLNRMINQLKEELNFDFNNPSYKKLDEELSNNVRAIYQLYANQCNLEKNRPIYSSNGVLIANGFDRIVIGDYGPYIEFTKEQANEKEFVVATGQEYRLTPRYHSTIKYEWYSTKHQDCKLYWQLRPVVYADYKPERYYISPFEVHQKLDKKTVGIIIAGGRDFTDYMLLKSKCNFYLSKLVQAGYTIQIISGRAKGADDFGERYAKEMGYGIVSYPVKWIWKDGKCINKSAGYERNKKMAEDPIAYALIAFWDKRSRGTKHMIGLAKEHDLHVKIVNY